ncbi:MAG: ATP-binding cassette domain-containing protein [Erysipelotrichaceae bacterium]
MEILTISDLSFTYPESSQQVLDQCNLSVKQGEFVLLCGSSGCGKTTLLKLCKKELQPYGKKQGKIVYMGKDIETLEDCISASQIGFVFQNPAHQIVCDKVWHELAFGLENLGVDQNQIRLRVGEMASFFGLEDIFYQDCDTLSGGQKQMLNLAAILCMQPKILLLDEPTSQLDPIAAQAFLNTLAHIHEEFDTTIILVEHRLEQLFPLVDRVAIMSEGKVIVDTLPRLVCDELMKVDQHHPMLEAMPIACRLYAENHNEKDVCPITIREGKQYLREHYKCDVKQLTKEHKQNSEVVLAMKHIYFRYEKEAKDILTDFSFNLHKGTIHCILGGNGSGKTTMLKCALSLLKPQRGKCILEKGLKCGYIPQDPTSLFVCDQVEAECKQVSDNIDEVVELFHLESLLKQHPYDLSGGEQQKLALAKIYLLNCDILCLDEPTKGLDMHSRMELGKLLTSLCEKGKTIFMVSHDIEFAAAFSDECSLLFDGRMIASGEPNEFLAHNRFYTSSGVKLTSGIFENVITSEDVMRICQLNGRIDPS